ncbi:response regulator transcription factor [Nakamurella sp. GG22]
MPHCGPLLDLVIPVTAVLSAAPANSLTKTVLVCDHHPVVRRSLSEQFAGNHSHLRVVQAVPDGRAAVSAFSTRPTDVVLVGIHRGTASGTAALDMLSRAYPLVPIIVFGSAHDSELLIDAIGQGAHGLMLWDIARPLPRQQAASSANGSSRRERSGPLALTDLERTLLHRIGEGQTNSEIARKMYLSVDAVKTRCRILFRKLGARDRAHAVALGLRDGLLT